MICDRLEAGCFTQQRKLASPCQDRGLSSAPLARSELVKGAKPRGGTACQAWLLTSAGRRGIATLPVTASLAPR